MIGLLKTNADIKCMEILPEFKELPVNRVNLFFLKLGLSFDAKRAMSHAEIFKIYSFENISWKNQQQ